MFPGAHCQESLRTQGRNHWRSQGGHVTIEALIKNENSNNGGLCDTEKKLKEGSIISEIEISKVKLNVLLINSI